MELNDFLNSNAFKKEAQIPLYNVEELSDLQKSAIIKAVLYIISADGVITDEEKSYYKTIALYLNATEKILNEATTLSDDVMFDTLKEVKEKANEYLCSILYNAAIADNELDPEENKLISKFEEYIPKGEKPADFYNQLLTF